MLFVWFFLSVFCNWRRLYDALVGRDTLCRQELSGKSCEYMIDDSLKPSKQGIC